MRQGGERSRHIQNFTISAAAHVLCLILFVVIPNWGAFGGKKRPEHKIYTFDLIDPSMISMKKTSGAPLSSTAKTTAPPKKDTVKVKKDEPKKKKDEPKKEEPRKKEPKKKDKTADKKKPPKEKPVFSKKSIAEKIKERLKKIEEESKSEWVEPDKAEELFKPASQGKIAEQGIAGLLNTGDFLNVSYNDAVASLIYQAWQPPSKTPVDKENPTVVVRFKIAKDGTVSNPRVEKKSGSEVLDTSALQAIKDSSPMPPLPDDYAGDSLEVCMTFVPVPEE